MLEIRYLPLDDLAPAARNPRTHSPSQIKMIERSLSRFGWTNPVGIADGQLVFGHARTAAARNLRERGIPIPRHDDPNTAPVVDLSELTEAERRAYLIADNQLALAAGWDDEALGIELRELSAGGFDLAVIGFKRADLQTMLIEPVGDQEPGALLELTDITIAEPRHTVAAGDHWLLGGRHHLLCASVIEDWHLWRPLLKKGCLFAPYPGPFVPFASRAKQHDLVMVQPDAYIAGHILDRFADIRGEDALAKAEA